MTEITCDVMRGQHLGATGSVREECSQSCSKVVHKKGLKLELIGVPKDWIPVPRSNNDDASLTLKRSGCCLFCPLKKGLKSDEGLEQAAKTSLQILRARIYVCG